MTTTNECDLKEARRLALEKFVELSYKDGWERDRNSCTIGFVHRPSGYNITDFYFCVSVWLGSHLIAESYPVSYPKIGPYPKGDVVIAAYERIKGSLRTKQDSTECHELMAALGRIKE